MLQGLIQCIVPTEMEENAAEGTGGPLLLSISQM